PDLFRSDLFDGVRFVENNEVVWKKKTTLPPFLFLRATKQHKEQRVIENNHVRGQQSFPRLLIEAARILSAGFLSAEVSFTANLRPNFRIRLDVQIAQ